MNLSAKWQLFVPDGHGVFAGKITIHEFDSKEEGLAFLADFIVAPAIKKGDQPPKADLRAVIRHVHRKATPDVETVLADIETMIRDGEIEFGDVRSPKAAKKAVLETLAKVRSDLGLPTQAPGPEESK